MRVALVLGRALVAGLWGLALGCTPRDDLSSFAAGTRAERPLEPAGEGDPAPGEEKSAAAPGGTPAPVETPAQPSKTATSEGLSPTDLADGEQDGATPPKDSGSSGSPGNGDAAPAEEAPAPSGPPPSAPPAGQPPQNAPPGGEPPTNAPPTGEPPPSAGPPPPQFRFVRLVADSDVTAGPLTSIAEFDVLGVDGQPLVHAGWVATADSAEAVFVGGAPAAFAIDGLATTMWHTPWFQVQPPPHPHFLQLDLQQPQSVGGFRYLARQDDAPEGRIAAYRFFVSADGIEWGEPVVAGTLANTQSAQDVRIPAP